MLMHQNTSLFVSQKGNPGVKKRRPKQAYSACGQAWIGKRQKAERLPFFYFVTLENICYV